MNINRSNIKPYCELVDEAFLRYNTELINNDERIEESLLVNNKVLDGNSTENEAGDCMSESGIIDLEIRSPLLLHSDEEITDSIRSNNVKGKFFIIFCNGQKKSETENLNHTQRSEII